MATKYQYYSALADHQTRQVTQSMGDWTGFLNTAGRLYKYPFEEQLMIHAQRPNAIACAPLETWNKPMNRWVKLGAKGIALLDNTGNEGKLKYVFDIADTQDGRGNTRRPFLWSVKPEHETPVIEALKKSFEIDDEKDMGWEANNGAALLGGFIGDYLYTIAQSLSARYYEDNKRDIGYAVEDSFLDGLDEFNIGVAFQNALAISTAYAIMTRCGVDTSHYINNEEFQAVFDFNTPDSVYALGKAVSDVSEEVLRDIEITIKQYERQKAVGKEGQRYERSDSQQSNIQQERGLSDTQHHDTRTEQTVEQIRNDEEGLPQETQGDSVHEAQHEGDFVFPLPRSREPSEQSAGLGNERTVNTEPAAEQNQRPAGLDGTHGQSENPSGGSHNQRIDSQLEPTETPSEQPQVTNEGNFITTDTFSQVGKSPDEQGDNETVPPSEDALVSPFDGVPIVEQMEQISLPDFPTEQEQIENIRGNRQDELRTEPSQSAIITQEDIDKAILDWNGDLSSKIRVFEYMYEHARARDTAKFLYEEYNAGQTTTPSPYSKDGLRIIKDGAEPLTLPWAKVQRRIGQLMDEDKFLSIDEQEAADNALDVIWERLTEENDQPTDTESPPEQIKEAEPLHILLGSPQPVFFVNWEVAQHDFDMNLYKDHDKIGYNKDGVEYAVGKMGNLTYITTTTGITPWGDITGATNIPRDVWEQMNAYRNGELSDEDVRANYLSVLDAYKKPPQTEISPPQPEEPQGTPFWQDYQAIATEHKDKILFYRLGDFYEVLGSDANAVAKFLNLAIAGRDVGLAERVPLVGVPAHTLDGYVERLVGEGFGVAIRHGTDNVAVHEVDNQNETETEQPTATRYTITPLTVVEQISSNPRIVSLLDKNDNGRRYGILDNQENNTLKEDDGRYIVFRTESEAAAYIENLNASTIIETSQSTDIPTLDLTLSPTTAIAAYVKTKLETGEKFTSAELFAEATKAYNDTMANNVFTSKDAYDAMELGVNQYILATDNLSLENLINALDILPSQTRRTAEMERFQQFSSPPTIAYLANWAANVTENDVVLEPSAGIGGLAVFAKKDGAAVFVNELDKRRHEIIKNLPFDGFFNEDAEQINNIHGNKLEPTVIVMNPPFSSSAERNIHNTSIGAKHIDEALKMLAPNGRLVAIVGQGMADDAPAFRNWWRGIKEQYNVKANVGVDGKNYQKYGTTFGVQVLVIDKNGATTEPVKTAFVEDLTDLQTILGGVRNDRPSIQYEVGNGHERNTATATRFDVVTEGEPERKPDDPVSVTGGRIDTADIGIRREQTDTSAIDSILDGIAGAAPDLASVGDDGLSPIFNGERHRGNDGRNDVDIETGRTGDIDSGEPHGSVEPRVRPLKSVKTELTDSIFENYEPQPLLLRNVQPHPANISESAAMSAIQPPLVSYKPNLSQEIIDNGILSDVQLEAVTYAGQSHNQTLPNGNARGFFLGDGTGVGKGRTVTGIILDNFNRGSKKAVWLSENRGLVPDAKRDVTALFGNSDLVTEFEGGKKADASLSNDEAILFTTYSALSKGFDQTGSNFEKIVNWLGKDFDGVIIFDEAHNMANSIATKGNRGVKKASQRGMAGVAIQEALPNAKIIYSSATGATEVENLRYAERLGLWGEGTAFPNGDDFVHRIKAGGLAAMELIARDMKAMGVYLSRNISYEDVVYDKIVHELTPTQRQIYDELARSWQIVFQNLNKALEMTNQNLDGTAKGRAYGAFWSAEQRFFNQILTAMQVPSMIADIQKQLDEGNSIVVQLVSTNESAQEREFARLQEQELDLEDFDLTPKQMLMSYIENSFPTVQFEEYMDDNGNLRSKPVFDSEGNAVINREAVRQKEMLLDKLGSIKVPASALDMIINHFGSDMVAENTGRKRRVVITDGKAKEENIASKKQADVSAFQDGDKRIIVFSKAGGTGKSYHADKSAKNQQHRVHYLLQAGWQADAAVQGFGRSHRSNQVTAPTFSLVTTDLKGQMRFISTIAKRLDQLGALTKGQRQTGSQGLFTAGDNLENAFAADVLSMFYKSLIHNRVEGISDGIAVIEKLGLKDKLIDEYGSIISTATELREVNKFLNRILSLECDEQNAVFDGYAERLHIATEKAMQDGTLDRGLENFKADKVVLNETYDIRADEMTGATTKYFNLTAYNKTKPLAFGNVKTENSSFMGFYQSKNTGAVRAVFKTSSITDEHGNVTENCRLTGQDGNEYMPLSRLMNNWNKLTPEKAESLWDKAVSELPEFRTSNLHLIGGTVLPVWDKLPTENVRIYRVLTSEGDLLIGRVIPEDMIDATLERLGATREKEQIETVDLLKSIKNGDTVYLDNDWRIVQRRVSNEQRLEVIGADYLHSDLLTKKGLFTERIGFQTRYFIPAEKDTIRILDEVLKIAPVSWVAKNNERSSSMAAKANSAKEKPSMLDAIERYAEKSRAEFGGGDVSTKKKETTL
ncbi:MAG: strawberry notch family protein [Defluviitaleaceae bacterium]|nr:strawberry notch family protein [Defluviitaleaceae bacterium]